MRMREARIRNRTCRTHAEYPGVHVASMHLCVLNNTITAVRAFIILWVRNDVSKLHEHT